MGAEREQLKGQLKRAVAQLEERRARIVGEISEEVAGIVEAIRIPSVETASVHNEKYLPVINGKIFSQAVQIGGGMTTAIQVAYWSSLLAVSLRNHDTNYPAFLLLDSPRLALNTAENLTAALYHRLVTQADANPGRVQFIIADNELPPTYRGRYIEIDFGYSNRPSPPSTTPDGVRWSPSGNPSTSDHQPVARLRHRADHPLVMPRAPGLCSCSTQPRCSDSPLAGSQVSI